MAAKPDQAVTLTISEAGWLSTFQDLGREDSEYMGVPCGGAADQHSAAVANILVGNQPRRRPAGNHGRQVRPSPPRTTSSSRSPARRLT